ncbi:protein of unknown function [Streptantibioticus cattleyicolor NRRL 8057 = DSM 46488]|nr:protein of unknown function [Streptantibioticus cattleyicolor NRRL 8057 = DSM 46488]
MWERALAATERPRNVPQFTDERSCHHLEPAKLHRAVPGPVQLRRGGVNVTTALIAFVR